MTKQFVDMRCKKCGNLTIFSKSSNLHYYKGLVPNVMNISVYTAMWLNNRKQFFKGFKVFFPYSAKDASAKANIQFKRNNVLPNEDEEY